MSNEITTSVQTEPYHSALSKMTPHPQQVSLWPNISICSRSFTTAIHQHFLLNVFFYFFNLCVLRADRKSSNKWLFNLMTFSVLFGFVVRRSWWRGRNEYFYALAPSKQPSWSCMSKVWQLMTNMWTDLSIPPRMQSGGIPPVRGYRFFHKVLYLYLGLCLDASHLAILLVVGYSFISVRCAISQVRF